MGTMIRSFETEVMRHDDVDMIRDNRSGELYVCVKGNTVAKLTADGQWLVVERHGSDETTGTWRQI